jgi:hypothetical protein
MHFMLECAVFSWSKFGSSQNEDDIVLFFYNTLHLWFILKLVLYYMFRKNLSFYFWTNIASTMAYPNSKIGPE